MRYGFEGPRLAKNGGLAGAGEEKNGRWILPDFFYYVITKCHFVWILGYLEKSRLKRAYGSLGVSYGFEGPRFAEKGSFGMGYRRKEAVLDITR